MTRAGKSRIRRNGHFNNTKSLHLDQRGQKAMCSVEEVYLADAFTFKYAVCAPGIANVFAGQFVPNPIRNSRRSDPDPIVSVAAGRHPRSANAI
jgi:hypothetical protein